MKQHIALVSLLVADYDEAIGFYTQKLNFELREDTILSGSKRWVVIAPKGDGKCGLLLAKGADKNQLTHIGNQTGGRVFLFLHTDDFWGDYHKMLGKGVHFNEGPREESYGTVAVFKDLYGNLWDLIGHR